MGFGLPMSGAYLLVFSVIIIDYFRRKGECKPNFVFGSCAFRVGVPEYSTATQNFSRLL